MLGDADSWTLCTLTNLAQVCKPKLWHRQAGSTTAEAHSQEQFQTTGIAQLNIKATKLRLPPMFVAQVLLSGVGASCYVVWLFMRVARSRAALFTCFLVIPSPLLRTLATKAVDLGGGDSDEEGGCV